MTRPGDRRTRSHHGNPWPGIGGSSGCARRALALPALALLANACAGPAPSASSPPPPEARGGSFALAASGRPRCDIVVAEKEAAGPVLFAAQELQKYVEAMSGARPAIVRAPAALPAIVLTTQDPAVPGVDVSPVAPAAADRYRMRVTAQGISLAGATPRAVLYAAYDLLERLGCGWCVPGDDTVPRRDTLSLPALEIDTAPAFQHRMMLDFPLQSVGQSIAIVDWIAKNRLNWVHPCPNAHGEPTAWYDRRDKVAPEIEKRGLHVMFGGHTMHTWLPEDYFQAHPAWFAYNKGERKPPELCVSNRELIPELVRNMRRFLDRCPEVDVVDLWHPDTEVFCHCAVCTRGLVPESAQGVKPDATPADAVQAAYVISYFEFMNRVAAEIARSHPAVKISPLIYAASDRAMPDGCPAPADNLFPGLAHISRDSYRPLTGEPKSAVNMRFLGNDITWMAKAKHHYIYEYYNCWIPPYLYPGVRVIVRDLQILKEVGAQGGSSDMYGYSPVNMYVAARALWSPDLDWEAAVRDFCLRYFGDAGGEMADSEVALDKGAYGRSGYQSSRALKKEWPEDSVAEFLNAQRPGQIAFLERMIGRTKSPEVKARLERWITPWKAWSEEPRFWAFPRFQ